MSALEKIREQLKAAAPPDADVTDKTVTFYFDEDTAAAAEVAIQRGGGFLLVVVAARRPSMNEFMVRVWSRYVPEIWVVDSNGRTVERTLRGSGKSMFSENDTLTPLELPTTPVSLAAVFSP